MLVDLVKCLNRSTVKAAASNARFPRCKSLSQQFKRLYSFQGLQTGSFTFTAPRLQNQYNVDWFLRLWLQTNVPDEVGLLVCYDLMFQISAEFYMPKPIHSSVDGLCLCQHTPAYSNTLGLVQWPGSQFLWCSDVIRIDSVVF